MIALVVVLVGLGGGSRECGVVEEGEDVGFFGEGVEGC